MTKLMKKTFPILILFLTILGILSCSIQPANNQKSINDSNNTNTTKLKNGDLLSDHYPFDSIKQLWMQNWKGRHLLNAKQKNIIIDVFKNAKFSQGGADIKPGHLNFTFVFCKGDSDGCYGSNNSLVFEGGAFYRINKMNGEFNLDKEFNFENY